MIFYIEVKVTLPDFVKGPIGTPTTSLVESITLLKPNKCDQPISKKDPGHCKMFDLQFIGSGQQSITSHFIKQQGQTC
jgi:hypothetical protein